MPEDNVQAETVETTETETTETETKDTPETKTEDTVETPADETTETATEQKEETQTEDTTTDETTETTEDEVEPEDTEDTETDDKSVKELGTVKGQLKKEQKKVDGLKDQVKGLETVVSEIIDAKMLSIPEEFHALVPEGNMVAKLAWINKAEGSGLFNKKGNPDVEIGKPLNLGNKNEKATSNTTAQQKLSNYFSNFYSN